MFWMSVRGKGEVCRLDKLGRDPEVLVRIWAAFILDLEALFAFGRLEEDLDSVVERRFGFEGREEEACDECREEVDVRGLDSWYPESWRDIFIASNFCEETGVLLVGEEGV
jgi:hypothetical protein